MSSDELGAALRNYVAACLRHLEAIDNAERHTELTHQVEGFRIVTHEARAMRGGGSSTPTPARYWLRE